MSHAARSRYTRFNLTFYTLCACALCAYVLPPARAADASADAGYKPGPDAEAREGVPHGTVTKYTFADSKVFPGTSRDYWVYVPAQYKPERPAALMVFFDGQAYADPKGAIRVPIVFDNLIEKGQMPVTVAVLVNPGGHKDKQPPGGKWRADNRSFEYDTLHDLNVRLLVEEILPEVEKTVKLTHDPEGRAVCGMSSGGIAAFTAAWERPDQFRKVVSHIGSFTAIAYRPAQGGKGESGNGARGTGEGGQPMRPGGDLYPTLIRKNPPKPLRVFLQDGSHDLDNEHGNWFLANQQMLAALEFANRNVTEKKLAGPRYDVNHAWGEGVHSPRHGGSIFPDTLRWLWRDYHPGEREDDKGAR